MQVSGSAYAFAVRLNFSFRVWVWVWVSGWGPVMIPPARFTVGLSVCRERVGWDEMGWRVFRMEWMKSVSQVENKEERELSVPKIGNRSVDGGWLGLFFQKRKGNTYTLSTYLPAVLSYFNPRPRFIDGYYLLSQIYSRALVPPSFVLIFISSTTSLPPISPEHTAPSIYPFQ